MIKAARKKRGSSMKVFFHVTVLAESSLACLIIFCRWILFLHQLKSEVVVTATLCKVVEDWDGKMRQSLPKKLPFLLCFIFKKYRFVKTALATSKFFKASFEAVKALFVVLCETLRHYLIVQLATVARGETWCLFCYLEVPSQSCCLPFSFKL